MGAHVETKIVSKSNDWSTGTTVDLTVTLDAAPDEDDIVIAFGRQSFVSATVTNLDALGFEEIDSSAGWFLAWKQAGASEASSYAFTTDETNPNNDGFCCVSVYDGISATTPFGTVLDLALHKSVNTSSLSQAVMPISNKATNDLVVLVNITGVVTGGPPTLTAPADYTIPTDGQGGVDNGPYGGIAYDVIAAPGIESPADWGIDVAGSSTVFTLAFRDASAPYIEVADVTWQPATGYAHVTYLGDVIPETSLLHKHRGTHTGANGQAALTDSAKSLALNEWEGLEVYNFPDNSTGVIDAHSAGTGPHALSEALAGGTDNDFDTGDSYDVRIKMVAGDQIGYTTLEDATTAGAFSFEYYLIDSTDGGKTPDATITANVPTLPANKTGTVSLNTVGSPSLTITGDAATGGSIMSAIFGEGIFGEAIFGDNGGEAAADVTAPTISSAAIDSAGTSLTITHDESVDFGAGGNGGFTLSTGQTLTYSSGSGSTALVYSISPAVGSTATPTLAYTQPGNGVEDDAGNDLVTFSGQAITNNSTVDLTAPTVDSAAINAVGTSLTITHDESVSIGAGGNGGFALSTGQTLTYSSGSGSTDLVYTISPAVEIDESPTLAYTQPTDGVEDAAGNDLATFSGQAITNNSLVGISAAPGGDVVDSVQTLIHDTGAILDMVLTNDTWVAAGTAAVGDIAYANEYIAALTSAQSEAGGWNAKIRDVLTYTALTRVNDTTLRLTIPATAGFVITANETITPVIPNELLTLATGDVTASSFQIRAALDTHAFSNAISRGLSRGFSRPISR